MTNAEEPVYPDPMRGTERSMRNQTPHDLPIGLTKREYFAGLALQGLVSDFDGQSKANGRFIPAPDYPILAECAVQLADELLKALEK